MMMAGPAVVQQVFSLALTYSVDIYSHESSSLVRHIVEIYFNVSVVML